VLEVQSRDLGICRSEEREEVREEVSDGKGRSSTRGGEDALCESERLRLPSGSTNSLEHLQRSTGLLNPNDTIKVSFEMETKESRSRRRKEKEERKTHVQQLLQHLIRHSGRYTSNKQRSLSTEFLLLDWRRDGRKMGRSRRRSSEAWRREVGESSSGSFWPWSS